MCKNGENPHRCVSTCKCIEQEISQMPSHLHTNTHMHPSIRQHIFARRSRKWSKSYFASCKSWCSVVPTPMQRLSVFVMCVAAKRTRLFCILFNWLMQQVPFEASVNFTSRWRESWMAERESERDSESATETARAVFSCFSSICSVALVQRVKHKWWLPFVYKRNYIK